MQAEAVRGSIFIWVIVYDDSVNGDNYYYSY